MTRLRRTLAAILALSALAALTGMLALSAAHAQSGDSESVRVIARAAADGRVEFGLRTAQGDQTPRQRFFPASVTHSRWLRSSPITLADGSAVRIIARRSGARLEFGIRLGDDPENVLPRARFFPLDTAHQRWLVSSALAVPTTMVSDAADQPAPEPEPEPADDPDPDVERISGGHRDGLIVDRGVVGDLDAPVLIVEYGDPF